MINIRLKRTVFSLLLVIASEWLAGCSLLDDMLQQDSIAEYGEAVFRKQNLITSQVMLLPETELSAENYQKLQQAESQMQKECKLLNEYATREMDKANIDLLFQKQVRDSISGCDASIQGIETLLNQLGIND
jgi:hypothetical protein